MDSIRVVDLTKTDPASFVTAGGDCIVLTKDGKLLLQQRPANWRSRAGCLVAFGGHIEAGETPLQGMIRELKEELGAVVLPADVISLGAISETETHDVGIIHVYFWHDKAGTITGCYECEAVYYDRAAGALAHPKIMDYVVWALDECRARGLIL